MLNSQYPVPPWMFPAVMNTESGGNPNAVSPAGAVGSMQTMPATLSDPGYGVMPAKDNSPQEQQRVGNDYLQAMNNRYQGNQQLALMAYNWGPGHVDKLLNGQIQPSQIPAETQAYVPKVLAQGKQYAANQPDQFDLGSDLYGDNQQSQGNDQSFDLGGELYGDKPQDNTAMDMLKSAGGGIAKGTAYMLPTMINQLFAGPQYLGRGIADTVEGNPTDRNFQPWQPFPMSSLPDAIQPHEPQTTAGMGMDFLGQLLGGAAASKIGQSDAMQNFISNTKVPNADATPTEKLSAGINAAQEKTRFSRPTNPLEAGQEANQAISHQYGIDTALQRELYDNVDAAGTKFSMPANETYDKLNDLTAYLGDKVAVESPEYRAYSELKEIGNNLQSKYGIAGTPDKTIQMPSWKTPIKIKGESGQEAYGMQPSDAVDIKTTLNQLAKSGKFTNAGQAKILDFKNYIQDFLDDASKVSPEFGDALDKAETQAARVGLYKDPKLASLWKPKPDYMSYKGETDTPADTFDRMANFMSKLNSGSPAAGESYSLAQILPHEQVRDIFRNALLQNKQAPEGVWQNLKTLGGFTRMMGSSPDSPLLDLANQLRNMK